MDFTWEHIIILLKKLYGWNQSKIADLIGVDRSTISRLKSGELPCLNLNKLCKNFEDFYEKLFAKEGPANQTKALNEMKQELEEMGFGTVIKDLDDSSRKSFTIELLKLANSCRSKGNASQDNPVVAPATPNEEKGDKRATHSPLQEPLYKCFVSAVAGFPIEKFFDSDPADSLADYLIRDAVTFWGRINAGRNQEDTPDRTTETYQNIICFIDALEDYLGSLMVNSRRPDAFPNDFQFIGGNGEIVDKANSYRERAKDLFNAALEAVQEKVAKERTDVIHAGEYSPPPALKKYQKNFKAT